MIKKQRLISEVERLLPEYVQFLSKLVRIDSVYGKEGEVQLLVRSRMEEIGIEVKTYYSREDQESVNLVSVIPGVDRERCKSLILNAHADIAPVDDAERWPRDPFSGEIVDSVLYGRCAQDDKAGIAIILLIVHVLRNTGSVLKGDLIIESVIEDETSGNGSKVLVKNGFTADGVIIVDGTWSERIIYAHLGQVWLDFTIMGDPVAACVESRGINPVYIAMELTGRLREFISSLNASATPFETIEAPYFINVGSLHSGVWHGSVPSCARMEVQIGFPGEISPEELIRRVTAIAKSVDDKIQVSENLLKTPAYKTARDNNLVKKLQSVISNNSGKEVLVMPVTGHCDMRHFPTPDICLYGPGGGKNAHGIDEYYFLDQMPRVATNLLDFLHEWCNEPR